MSFRRDSVIVQAVVMAKESGQNGVVEKCLCDSGAIGGSFIGKDTLESLEGCILRRAPANIDEVTLADKLTQLKLEEKVLLKIQIPNSKRQWKTAYIWFYVVNKPFWLIVGLHDLQDNFLDEFIDLLRAGAQERAQARHCRRLDAIIVDIDDVDRYYVYGWSGVNKYKHYVKSNIAFNLESVEPGSLGIPLENVDKDAPELGELETPVNFADFHEYMTMSSVEIDAAYKAEIEKHVSDSMLANTKLRKLLRGKAKGAFVPNGKWEGLKSLEPLWPKGLQGLELTWMLELVDQLRSKNKAQPINPKLYAACEEESERLKQYIYIDSGSEIIRVSRYGQTSFVI